MNCKDLQRTLHHIRAYQTQSNLEVRRCRVSVLNRYLRAAMTRDPEFWGILGT